MAEYSLQEMMAITAARGVRNSDIILCGTGIATLAAIAAKKITAPGVSIFFETGAVDVQFKQMPLSLADPRIMHGAIRLPGGRILCHHSESHHRPQYSEYSRRCPDRPLWQSQLYCHRRFQTSEGSFSGSGEAVTWQPGRPVLDFHGTGDPKVCGEG